MGGDAPSNLDTSPLPRLVTQVAHSETVADRLAHVSRAALQTFRCSTIVALFDNNVAPAKEVLEILYQGFTFKLLGEQFLQRAKGDWLAHVDSGQDQGPPADGLDQVGPCPCWVSTAGHT